MNMKKNAFAIFIITIVLAIGALIVRMTASVSKRRLKRGKISSL